MKLLNRTADPFTPGLLGRVPEPERVAVVCAAGLADFIAATPAFRALRAALPAADITLVGGPAADLAARSPNLDRFEPIPDAPAEPFFARLRAARFDLALALHDPAGLARQLGARVTAGFARDGEAADGLDAALAWPAEASAVRRNLALVTFLGVPPQGEHLEFPLWADDHAHAEALLHGAPPPLWGVSMAADHVAAGRELQARHGGTVVRLGGAAVAGLDLVGRTSLPVLGAVIARLAVLLTDDPGPAHIGYALKAPTVAVGGPDPPAGAPARVLPAAPGDVAAVVRAAAALLAEDALRVR